MSDAPSGAIPVFVNDRPIRVPAGSEATAAVAQLDQGLADAIATGRAYLTDGRGIDLDPRTRLEPGAIIRVVVSSRRRSEPDDPQP
jgi:hypothetical protein